MESLDTFCLGHICTYLPLTSIRNLRKTCRYLRTNVQDHEIEKLYKKLYAMKMSNDAMNTELYVSKRNYIESRIRSLHNKMHDMNDGMDLIIEFESKCMETEKQIYARISKSKYTVFAGCNGCFDAFCRWLRKQCKNDNKNLVNVVKYPLTTCDEYQELYTNCIAYGLQIRVDVRILDILSERNIPFIGLAYYNRIAASWSKISNVISCEHTQFLVEECSIVVSDDSQFEKIKTNLHYANFLFHNYLDDTIVPLVVQADARMSRTYCFSDVDFVRDEVSKIENDVERLFPIKKSK